MSHGPELKSVKKRFSDDQDKACHPAETISRVRKSLREMDEDILTRTMRIDSGRLGIPVFLSICGKDAIRTIGTQKQMGKGNTPEQSEASALMELVERYSFFSFLKAAPYKVNTLRELGKEAPDVSAFLSSVHDDKTHPSVVREVLDTVPLRWVKGYNITREKDQYIPLDWFYLINEYNGPAAGNTMEEAILQGLCEVVERHVGSVISHDKLETPTILQSSVQYPTARVLLDKFLNRGIELVLKDFSLNTGIPTIGALAYDPTTFPEKSEIVFTAGTTTNPEKSLCRALTEVAQLAGDFERATTYRPTLPKYTSLDEAKYLFDCSKEVSVRELPDVSSDDFLREIHRCVKFLKRAGMEVLVLDITHPSLKIPAAYCMVPGAHFRERTRNTDFVFHFARVISRYLPAETVLGSLEYLDSRFRNRFDLQFFSGLAKEKEGLAREAIRFYERALELDPDPMEIASIYVHEGSCFKDLERYEDALSCLEKAEECNPGLKEIYNLKGFCFYKMKEHRRAIAEFEKAIEIDPGSAIDYANIASNLRELGHLKEALHLYKMALDLDPDIEFAHDNVVKIQAVIEGEG